jgi:hypothetical protein
MRKIETTQQPNMWPIINFNVQSGHQQFIRANNLIENLIGHAEIDA